MVDESTPFPHMDLSGPEHMHPMAGMAASPVLTSAHKIAVAGLGLIGGSLARRLASRGRFVIAWNHNDRPYEQARSQGIHCVDTLEELAKGKPDVLVLATPLRAMPEVLQALAPVLTRGTTLTDVGSVKGPVRRQVEQAGLVDRYVGAHPMAGSEGSGYEDSDPALLEDALWALCVDEHTDYSRFLTVADMVTMPHVVATALANMLTKSPDRRVAAALAAGSWRDMTRVALTDPERTRAMVEENSDQVADLLDVLVENLQGMASLLRDQKPGADEKRRDFFLQADPFRRYRTALADQEQIPFTDLELDPQEGNWRQELMDSALRGEQVSAFLTTSRARVLHPPVID